MLTNEIIKIFTFINVTFLLLNPISYKKENILIDNLPQQVHTLSINMNNPNIDVANGLSFDMLYGFEKTSSIANRNDAVAAVNGMFYNDLGMPYGIMVKDSKVISMNSTKTPILCITEDNKVIIDEFAIFGYMKGDNYTINIYGTNTAVPDGSFILFNKIYGKTNRVRRKSVNYLIRDNKVVDIVITDQPTSLEGYDYVLTNVTQNEKLYFQKGEEVEIEFEFTNGLTNIKEAFQTGGWLVYDGENVAKDYESFMGYTLAPNPRTIIGVTKDNVLVIKVIDGRSKESVGVSGFQAANLMINEGCQYAVYLDGGASSTMIIEDKVINNPSDGEERDVSHAIIINGNQ